MQKQEDNYPIGAITPVEDKYEGSSPSFFTFTSVLHNPDEPLNEIEDSNDSPFRKLTQITNEEEFQSFGNNEDELFIHPPSFYPQTDSNSNSRNIRDEVYDYDTFYGDDYFPEDLMQTTGNSQQNSWQGIFIHRSSTTVPHPISFRFYTNPSKPFIMVPFCNGLLYIIITFILYIYFNFI